MASLAKIFIPDLAQLIGLGWLGFWFRFGFGFFDRGPGFGFCFFLHDRLDGFLRKTFKLYIGKAGGGYGQVSFLAVPQFGGHALFVAETSGRHRGGGTAGFAATLFQGDLGGLDDPGMT